MEVLGVIGKMVDERERRYGNIESEVGDEWIKKEDIIEKVERRKKWRKVGLIVESNDEKGKGNVVVKGKVMLGFEEWEG